MAVEQKKFLEGLLAAPQDVSLPVFEDLLTRGYAETDWQVSPGATDAPCLAKGGDKLSLADFIAQTSYNAPIYSKTHVGCKCTVRVTGPDLPDIVVGPFGIVEGDLPIEAPVEEVPEEPKEEEKPEPAEQPVEEKKEGEEPTAEIEKK